MSETAPITGNTFQPITGLLACDALRSLLLTRDYLQQYIEWQVNDDGTIADDFKLALVNQLLFDITRKGWFVRSNPTTGFLELVEKVPVSSLEDGTTDGDLIVWNGTTWEIVSPTYLSPTSGGTTLPDADTGATCSVAHGFPTRPKVFRCDLICTSADAGYSADDVVDALSLSIRGASSGEVRSATSVYANDTLIKATFAKEGTAPRKYVLPHPTTFDINGNDLDPAKWSVKFFATL